MEESVPPRTLTFPAREHPPWTPSEALAWLPDEE